MIYTIYDGEYHVVTDDNKLACTGMMVIKACYNDYDSDMLCKVCRRQYLGKLGNNFNINVFGNERMIRILIGLTNGSKRMAQMTEIMEETDKPHIAYELNKLMDCGLIEKEDRYYSLSSKGKIAVFIGDLILSLKDIDDDGIVDILQYLEKMKIKEVAV